MKTKPTLVFGLAIATAILFGPATVSAYEQAVPVDVAQRDCGGAVDFFCTHVAHTSQGLPEGHGDVFCTIFVDAPINIGPTLHNFHVTECIHA